MHIVPFKLERFFARYEFTVPYLLCSSDCEALTVGDLLAFEPDAQDALNRLSLGYTESPGAPALRAEIARLYETLAPDQILVHTGAEEAIFTLMNTLLQAGDHVIVHAPGYQSLYEIARAIGCTVDLWVGHEADNWALNVDDLKALIRPNTRLMVLNCPHNPTGYVMTPDAQRALVEVARQHGIVLFSDEVYRLLEHSAPTLPAACDVYENAVSLGVMSKTFGLAGLRIGWLATRRRDLLDVAARFKDYTTICNSAPSEFLATLALRHRTHLIQRSLDIVRANLEALDAFFARHPETFRWQRPHGGSTAFPALTTGEDVDTFCERLAERGGVLLLPGTVYDYGDRHFRLGYGRSSLPDALARLETFLAAPLA